MTFARFGLRHRLFSCVCGLLAGASLASSCPARAANIVTDGGFESAGGGNTYYSGSIDGGSWTVTKGAVYIDNNDPWVYDGANSANLTGANPYATTTLSQALATVAGLKYNLSFWADADIANTFSVTENGVSVAGTPTTIAQNGFPSTGTDIAPFVLYTGSFTATSGSTLLSFSSLGDPAIGAADYAVMLDDVSVQAAPTPEPGSLMLAGTGLAGVGSLVSRMRRRNSAV